MAVADKVKSIIVEQLGVDEEEVTPDASFVDDLGADSLDTVDRIGGPRLDSFPRADPGSRL